MSSQEVEAKRGLPTWVILLLCLTTVVLGAGLTKLLGLSGDLPPSVQNLGMLIVAIEAVAYGVIGVLLGARRLMLVLFAAGFGVLCHAAMAGGGALLLPGAGGDFVSSAQSAWLGDGVLLVVHGALVLLCLAFVRPMIGEPPAVSAAEEYEAPRPDVAESLAEFQTSAAAESDASREELVRELMEPAADQPETAAVGQPDEEAPMTYVPEEPTYAGQPPAPAEETPAATDETTIHVEETWQPAAAEAADELVTPFTAPETAADEAPEAAGAPALGEFPITPSAPVEAPTQEAAAAEEGPLFSFEMQSDVAAPEAQDAPAEQPEEPGPVLRFTPEGVEQIASPEEPALDEPTPPEPIVAEEPSPEPPALEAPLAEGHARGEAAATPAGAPPGQVAVSADAVLAQFPEGALNLTPDQLEQYFAERPFAVPLDVVLPQLAEGEIRIPARVIVEQLPPDALAVSEVELDAALADGMELPLEEVVPQIPAEHLAVPATCGAPPEVPDEDIFKVPDHEGFEAVITAGAEAPAEELADGAPAETADAGPSEAAREPVASVAPDESISVDAEAVLSQLPAEAFASSPEEVQSRLPEPVFQIPAGTVVPQLSSGQVIVSMSVIASQLPTGALLMSPDEIDESLPAGGIELPLAEVVAQAGMHIGVAHEQEPAPVIDDQPLFTPAGEEALAPSADEPAETVAAEASVEDETAEPGEPAPVDAEALPVWEPEPAAEEEEEEEAVEPDVATEGEPVEVAAEAWGEPAPVEVASPEPIEAEPDEPVSVEEIAAPSQEEMDEEVAPEPAVDIPVAEEPVAEAVSAIEEVAPVPEPEAQEPAVEPVAAAEATDEVGAAIAASAQQLAAPQTDWCVLPDGCYLASALAAGAEMDDAREAAAAVLTAGRELCDASERGALNAVLATTGTGSAALGWAVTPGGARVACQLVGAGTSSPGKVGAAAHKLMAALQGMELSGGEPSDASMDVSEQWAPFEGDGNGAEEAEKAASAVKLAGLASQLFVRGDGPRMILLGPQALLADPCVSAAGTLLERVANYVASIGLGEVEKVIVEGDTGAAALVPAQNGKPALVLLAPGSVKAGMASVQIAKAAAALGG
ncbi:MAG: hypothetical protein PVH68_01985 [Armatimonadota bacterium]